LVPPFVGLAQKWKRANGQKVSQIARQRPVEVESAYWTAANGSLILCGMLLQSKTFFVNGVWSEAVLCPACLRGAFDRWP
jgi:hypothetical protein